MEKPVIREKYALKDLEIFRLKYFNKDVFKRNIKILFLQ